jgi:hypothetical protein
MCCNFRPSISDKKASQYLATKDCIDKSDKSVFGHSLLYHLDNMDFHPGEFRSIREGQHMLGMKQLNLEIELA